MSSLLRLKLSASIAIQFAVICWVVFCLFAYASSSIADSYTPETRQKMIDADRLSDTPIDENQMISQFSQSQGDEQEKQRHGQALKKKKNYKISEHVYDLTGLPLTSMHGEKTSLEKELESDRAVMLNFIFTTCTTICPVLTATFSQVQDKLGDESRKIKMISISIDPTYDTPERLSEYAKRFNAGPQWQFYTGELADIIAVERAFNAFRGAKMSHDPLTFLKTAEKAAWIRLEGIASADDVIEVYRDNVKH